MLIFDAVVGNMLSVVLSYMLSAIHFDYQYAFCNCFRSSRPTLGTLSEDLTWADHTSDDYKYRKQRSNATASVGALRFSHASVPVAPSGTSAVLPGRTKPRLGKRVSIYLVQMHGFTTTCLHGLCRRIQRRGGRGYREPPASSVSPQSPQPIEYAEPTTARD